VRAHSSIHSFGTALRCAMAGAPFRYILAKLMLSGMARYVVKQWGCVVKISPQGKVIGVRRIMHACR
jgi:hypothetical protein